MSFDYRKEFEGEIDKMVDALVEKCDEYGLPLYINIVFVNDAEKEQEHGVSVARNGVNGQVSKRITNVAFLTSNEKDILEAFDAAADFNERFDTAYGRILETIEKDTKDQGEPDEPTPATIN